MRTSKTSGALLAICSLLLECGPFSLPAAESAPSTKPKLYDTAADGKLQIAEALKTAKAGNKRLILKLGANW